MNLIKLPVLITNACSFGLHQGAVNPCQVHRALKCLLRIMATVSKLRRMLIENLEASLTTDWQGRIFLLPMHRNLQTALT